MKTNLMSNRSLVSIIIPVFNNQSTVEETVASALAQDYDNLEIILVNDGSTDNTQKILEKLSDQHENIQLYNKSNEGVSASRNYGFRRSHGKYVVFLDADDLLVDTFVSECAYVMDNQRTLSVVYTQVQFFERQSGIFKLPKLDFQRLLSGNCLTVTAMIRAEMFESVNMYDEKLNYVEDWEFWIRLLHKYPYFQKIEKPLFLYRRRNSQDSATDLNEKNESFIDASLYVYRKHYDLYKNHGLTMDVLLDKVNEASLYKRKYYNTWYRRLFYLVKRSFKRK
ncbi:glycosyltransferase [Sphingobacterium sp.]|uniref:glycosyltransferase family 2 protein n=1 Tax=Sphingobacterium sp. TaxID=341027 RepID=UPI0028A78362|nr:glycosyltransferase [Sphingobacterium sp.]